MVVGFFLSAYTPQVVGFVVGQICFTIAVVAMFNLIVPQGWHTGLVRFENIIDRIVGERVVALLFWPRRASVGLRANVAALYRDLGRARDCRHRRNPAPTGTGARRRAPRRTPRTCSTSRRRHGRRQGRRPWATLLTDAAQVRFAIDGRSTAIGASSGSTTAARPRQALDAAARGVAGRSTTPRRVSSIRRSNGRRGRRHGGRGDDEDPRVRVPRGPCARHRPGRAARGRARRGARAGPAARGRGARERRRVETAPTAPSG